VDVFLPGSLSAAPDDDERREMREDIFNVLFGSIS
jgi:hypothetical protein